MKTTKHSFYTIVFGLLCIVQSSFAVNLVQNTSENQSDTSKVVCYNYPRLSPKSTDYKVRVNNKDVFVYNTSAAPFAAFGCNGPVTVEIEMPTAAKNVTVNPLKH